MSESPFATLRFRLGQATPPRPLCGHCDACLTRTAELLASAPRPCTGPRRAPTRKELELHARRFGPEGVEELAEELGVPVVVERARTTRKRTKGPTLKERVARHVADGHGVELIAELENLSPSRARRLIQEVK